MVKIKLENMVMPLLFGLSATALASGINKEAVKEGIEMSKTYLALIPMMGITTGYLLDRATSFLENKGYILSGSVPKP